MIKEGAVSQYIISWDDNYAVKKKQGLIEYFEDEQFEFSYKLKKSEGSDGDVSFKAKNKLIHPINEWFKEKRYKDVRDTIDFIPIEGFTNGGSIFNTFNGFNISPDITDCFIHHHNYSQEKIDELVKPYFDHIKTIWCQDDEENYEYILNWMAQTLKTPMNKTKVAVFLKSTNEGAGKDICLQPLYKIIGERHSVSICDFPGDFNGIVADRCLVNLNEAVFGGDKKIAGKMKNFITEPNIEIQKKYHETRTQKNYTNIIGCTNNDCFAAIDNIGQRRIFALELANNYAGIQNEESQKLYDRNRLLIDFDMIPENIKININSLIEI